MKFSLFVHLKEEKQEETCFPLTDRDRSGIFLSSFYFYILLADRFQNQKYAKQRKNKGLRNAVAHYVTILDII